MVIYGARQVGKTTLVKEILKRKKWKTLSLSGDRPNELKSLSSQNLQSLKQLVEGYELIFIDEAQRIPNIGINLKILHDEFPDLKIIATVTRS